MRIAGLRVEYGARPDQPTADSRLRAILHQHGPFTAGLVEQDRRMYVFWTVTGEVGSYSVSAFTQLNDDETRLLNAVPIEERRGFRTALGRLTGGKPTTLVVDSHAGGIAYSTYVEAPDPKRHLFEVFRDRAESDIQRGLVSDDVRRAIERAIADAEPWPSP